MVFFELPLKFLLKSKPFKGHFFDDDSSSRRDWHWKLTDVNGKYVVTKDFNFLPVVQKRLATYACASAGSEGFKQHVPESGNSDDRTVVPPKMFAGLQSLIVLSCLKLWPVAWPY